MEITQKVIQVEGYNMKMSKEELKMLKDIIGDLDDIMLEKLLDKADSKFEVREVSEFLDDIMENIENLI